MSNSHNINSPRDPSISFDQNAHPLGNLLKVATNQSLSLEARLLYVVLVLMAWSKGKCWPSQTYQARSLGRSERQVRRYHQELERSGVLGINRRPGQSSFYYPWALHGTPDTCDLRAQDTGVRLTSKEEQLKSVKNVLPVPTPVTCTNELPSQDEENVNALEILSNSEDLSQPTETPDHEPISNPILESFSLPEPPDTIQTQPPASSTRSEKTKQQLQIQPPKANLNPDQWFLLEETEQACNDFHSRGHFINLIRRHDEATIYAALSVTKEKMSLESGVRGGAYFTATLKGMTELRGLGSNPQPSIQPTSPPEIQSHPPCSYEPHRAPVLEPQPEPVDPDGLIKGLRFQWKSGGVSSLLLWADRCVSGVDTHELWGQIKELLPREHQETLVDRFLDTLRVRIQHQESTAREAAA